MQQNRNRIEHLYAQRQELQQQLEWHEANHAASAEESDDGSEVELKDQLRSIRDEIASLERLERKED
jgi:hypothetical protein